MKILNSQTLPSQEGFYFVKTKQAKYWQCLVRIVGKVPFLHISFKQSLFKTDDVNIISGDLTALDWSDVMILNYISTLELNDLERTALDLLRSGSKLQAVKYVKEKMNWGLVEAKNWCEELENRFPK